ncbi:MAG: glutathione S-transferase family protein [Nevskiaceae bacterium]|nr:MAG: glutathione S-transferase family protein [Nevskiaceae bacterium]TBR73466.1 MAG: glutathione S-transferase family protein [Nevskiaceae bacterium]
MKLYDWSIAPNPRRVRMYLAEKGLSVETIQAAGPRDMALASWFLELCPRRRVPLLVLDDGTQIGESMAICRYFEALHPEPAMFGHDACERGIVEMWERESDANCIQAGGENVRNAHPAFKDRAMPGYAQPTPQIPALAERGRMRYYAFQQQIDARLADHEFLAGPHFSVADITAFCGIAFWSKFRLSIAEENANVKRWFDAVSARSSATA